jgi:LysM repeat protein
VQLERQIMNLSRVGKGFVLAGLSLALVGCFQTAGQELPPTQIDLAAVSAATATFAPTALPTILMQVTETSTLPPLDTPSLPTETPLIPPTEVQPVTDSQPTVPPLYTETYTATPVEPTAEIPPTSPLLPTPTALPTQNPCIHVVQPGEWLLKIARAYNIDPQALRAANPQLPNPDSLNVGDQVIIPNCNADAQAPAPTTPPQPEAPINPTPSVQEAPAGGVPTPIMLSERVYTVASGDTLGAIARKFGITVQALKDANGLGNDFLRVGQQLRIPLPPPQ